MRRESFFESRGLITGCGRETTCKQNILDRWPRRGHRSFPWYHARQEELMPNSGALRGVVMFVSVKRVAAGSEWGNLTRLLQTRIVLGTSFALVLLGSVALPSSDARAAGPADWKNPTHDEILPHTHPPTFHKWHYHISICAGQGYDFKPSTVPKKGQWNPTNITSGGAKGTTARSKGDDGTLEINSGPVGVNVPAPPAGGDTSTFTFDETNKTTDEKVDTGTDHYQITVHVLDPNMPPCKEPKAARAPEGGGQREGPQPSIPRSDSSWTGPTDMKTHFGLFVGGGAITSLPPSSTSGFYSGNLNGTPVGFAFGGSVFRDIATFGNAPGPFGSYVLSGGLVIDYINHAPLTWSGTCGGTACTGTGSMNEFNYIGELKLTTPVSPGNTVNGYIGAGGATLWPSGTPTGTGGPSFQGSDTAPAARIGFGFDHKFNENWSAGAKVGFQFTGSTEYGTSLAGERFHLSRKNETIFGTTLTYTPSDIRLKRDITMVGHTDNGLGLYRYRYIWSDQVYVGVMAQEVAQIDPGAVMRGDDGYLRVNYERLGLRMQTWDEWKAAH
jgi:hypothetical protein